MAKNHTGGALSRQELADRLNVNPRTVTKWIAEGLPVVSRGHGREPSRFDLAAARDWRQTREESRRAARAQFEAVRARRELAQASEAEQRVRLRAAKLIRVEDADRVWQAAAANVRRRLLRFPGRVTPGLVEAGRQHGAAGVESCLQREVYRLLYELAGTPASHTRAPVRRHQVRDRGAAGVG